MPVARGTPLRWRLDAALSTPCEHRFVDRQYAVSLVNPKRLPTLTADLALYEHRSPRHHPLVRAVNFLREHAIPHLALTATARRLDDDLPVRVPERQANPTMGPLSSCAELWFLSFNSRDVCWRSSTAAAGTVTLDGAELGGSTAPS